MPSKNVVDNDLFAEMEDVDGWLKDLDFNFNQIPLSNDINLDDILGDLKSTILPRPSINHQEIASDRRSTFLPEAIDDSIIDFEEKGDMDIDIDIDESGEETTVEEELLERAKKLNIRFDSIIKCLKEEINRVRFERARLFKTEISRDP